MAFREDHSQVRTGYAVENVALVRRLVTSVVQQDDRANGGTQTKRMRAAWNDDDREHLLQQL